MSRSYKKFPCVKDRCSLKTKKREQPKTYASRHVRRSDDIPNGSSYKKLYCSWDISDYRFLPEENGFRTAWKRREKYLRRKWGSYENYRRSLLREYRNK